MRVDSDFRGKIHSRLSFLFVTLFVAVLLVGALSLYFAHSIFLSTEEIKKENERIDLLDQIHITIHYFTSTLQQASLQGTAVPDDVRGAYLQKVNTLLERYHATVPGEEGLVKRISQAIADLDSAAVNLTRQNLRSPTFVGKAQNSRDLETLADAERKTQTAARQLRVVHRAKIEQVVWESQWRMQIVYVFYAAFVLVGGFLVLGSSFFFSQVIARPLRRLAQAASEIAQGNFHEQVPVTSKDEIGQLSHAFNVMTDRLKEHEERLKELATLEERERIAQELHDSLAQDLALLRLKIIETEQILALNGSSAAGEPLREMRKIADGAYEDVREAIFGLRIMVSKSLSLIPALTEYLHVFSELRKIPVNFKIDSAEVPRFPPRVEVQLIRIIHEALTNVFKHAQATRIKVKIEQDGEFAKVTIEDNGKGCLAQEVMREGLRFGLQTMRERAEGVGGRLAIDTAPGKGTRVIVYLPFEKSSHETHSSASGR